MAFGNLATHLILFIAAISIATGVVVGMKTHVEQTANSIGIQQERLSSSLRTEMTIEVIKHVESSDTTYVYMKNTGNAKIDIEKIDVFTNSLRVPRNDTNRTIEVLSDTDTKNTGVWDPGEAVKVEINQALASDETHTITVAADNGVTADKDFSF